MRSAIACLLAMMADGTAAEVQDRILPVEGGKVLLRYRDSGGAGVPVVFLHAASGNSDFWKHQEPAVTKAGFRFIAYDRRGHGQTRVTGEGASNSAADDLEELTQHLRLDRFHLVGTAAGGGAPLTTPSRFHTAWRASSSRTPSVESGRVGLAVVSRSVGSRRTRGERCCCPPM